MEPEGPGNQGTRQGPSTIPLQSVFGPRPKRLPIFLVERGAGSGCRRGALEWSAVAKHTLYSLPLQPQPECEGAQRLGDSHEGPGEHLEGSGRALGGETDF